VVQGVELSGQHLSSLLHEREVSGYLDDVYHCVRLCCSADHGLMRLCPLDIPVEPHQRQEVQFGRLDLVAENLVAENLVAENLAAENLAAENFVAEDLVAENLVAVNPF